MDTSVNQNFFEKLRRSGWYRTQNSIAGGVCSGLAHKWNIDAVIVRGVALVLMLLSGLGMLIYGLLWLFLPEITTKRIMAEEAKDGLTEAKFVLPILLVIIGIIRIFPELTAISGFALFFMPGLGTIQTYEYTGDTLGSWAASIIAALMTAAVITWISVAIYRRNYSSAALTAGIAGLAAVLGAIFEQILNDGGIGLRGFMVLTRFLQIMLATIPVAVLIFLSVWLISRNSKSSRSMSTPVNTNTTQTTVPGAPTPSSSTVHMQNPEDQSHSTPNYTFQAGTDNSGYTAANTSQSPFDTSSPVQNSSFYPNYPDQRKYPTHNANAVKNTVRPPQKPRIAGPSTAFSLTLWGLILLSVAGTMVAQKLLNTNYLATYLVSIGIVTILLGLGVLILAVRRRRQTWLPWVSAAVVVCITIPATLTVYSLPPLMDYFNRYANSHSTVKLHNYTQDLQPGDTLNSLITETTIDLRNDTEAEGPIRINALDADVHIMLYPQQATHIKLRNNLDVNIELSTTSQWQRIETKTNHSFSLNENAKPKFNASGEKISYMENYISAEDSINIDLKNTAAASSHTKTQSIILNIMTGNIYIHEIPKELIWEGTVLPDGHYAVENWIDEHHVSFYHSDDELPKELSHRAVPLYATLGGREVEDYLEIYDENRLSLSEVMQGAAGPWSDEDKDGFNDNYQPGGKLWKPADTVYTNPLEEKTPTPAERHN